jgi:hypothetical protein
MKRLSTWLALAILAVCFGRNVTSAAPDLGFVVSTFSPWPGYAIQTGSWQAGDLNGDGKADLIHLAGSDYVHPWFSNGDGTFTVGFFQPWPGYGIQTGSWQSGDFNGDGREDLIHLTTGDYTHPWLSNGNGTFAVGFFQPWPGYGIQVGSWQSGDFNGDGSGDLVHLAGNDYVHPWLATTTTAPPPSPPPPAGFSTRNTTSYVTPWDTLHVVGEVVNNNPYNARFVKVIGSFYDANNNLIATDYTYSCLGVIPADGDSPFDLLLFDPPPGVQIQRYSLTVDGDATSEPPASGLALSSVSSYLSGTGTFHVVGQVTNNSSTTHDFVKVCGALYDANGSVARADYTYAQPYTLAPGAAAPFDLMFFDFDAEPASYRLWVDGDRQ